MLGEVAFQAEGHLTLITFESLHHSMLRSFMLNKCLLRFKLLRAPVALRRRSHCRRRLRRLMLPLVKIKIALVLVGLVALGALQSPTRVGLFVECFVRFGAEGALAVVTLERFQLRVPAVFVIVPTGAALQRLSADGAFFRWRWRGHPVDCLQLCTVGC